MLEDEIPVIDSQKIEGVKQLYQKLDLEFMPEWQNINNSLVLYKMEDFGNDLAALASQYSFDYLFKYSQEIIEAIDTVDLEYLQQRINQFPKIKENIKNAINGLVNG
jgi:hypothetical protein